MTVQDQIERIAQENREKQRQAELAAEQKRQEQERRAAEQRAADLVMRNEVLAFFNEVKGYKLETNHEVCVGTASSEDPKDYVSLYISHWPDSGSTQWLAICRVVCLHSMHHLAVGTDQYSPMPTLERLKEAVMKAVASTDRQTVIRLSNAVNFHGRNTFPKWQ